LEELVQANTSGKEFIYLSPDAEEELQEVDPENCIYIIGGKLSYLLLFI
jgi:Trm5-related predicted tRNA methylase